MFGSRRVVLVDLKPLKRPPLQRKQQVHVSVELYAQTFSLSYDYIKNPSRDEVDPRNDVFQSFSANYQHQKVNGVESAEFIYHRNLSEGPIVLVIKYK